jgi:cyclophilin family peptidyl-prolyl cis-trans isomerase
LVAVSKRRAHPAPEQTASSDQPAPMRVPLAIVIVALLAAAAVGGGHALDWSAHPAVQSGLSTCRTQTQLAPGLYAQAPPMCIDPHKNYGGTIVTTKGTISFVFLTGSTPQTVNNFIVLATNGYFNGLKFFNAQPWVIQSGDPQNNGHGGPGYTLPPEPPRSNDKWVPGSLGMARLPDGSINGSQFFILRDAWSGGDPTDVYNHFATITIGFDIASQLDQTDRILQVKVRRT